MSNAIYVDYETLHCHNDMGIGCGLSCQMESRIYRHIIAAGKVYYCPYCGRRWSSGETALTIIMRQKAALQARFDQEAMARREAVERAEKAEASRARLKRRVVAGACALCHRTFSNVAKHMAHRHPDAVKEARAK